MFRTFLQYGRLSCYSRLLLKRCQRGHYQVSFYLLVMSIRLPLIHLNVGDPFLCSHGESGLLKSAVSSGHCSILGPTHTDI